MWLHICGPCLSYTVSLRDDVDARTSYIAMMARLLHPGAESTGWTRDRWQHCEGYAADAFAKGPARLRSTACQQFIIPRWPVSSSMFPLLSRCRRSRT